MESFSVNCRVATRVGTIALADHGTGAPVVLWPSLFSDHRLYAHVARLVGKTTRVIGIDGPGFGQSDPPAGEVQADVHADVVLDVLDALEIERAVIGGCSWGGQVAAHVGVRAPQRVSGVLIMNAPLGPSLGGHAFEVFGTRWVGATAFWGGGVARSMFSKTSRDTHPDRVKAFVEAFRSFDRRAAATTVKTVLTRSPGLESILPHLTVPTTIVMGAEDALYPVARMRPIAHLAATARLEIVASCGHLAPLEAPEHVVASLRALTSGAPSAGDAPARQGSEREGFDL